MELPASRACGWVVISHSPSTSVKAVARAELIGENLERAKSDKGGSIPAIAVSAHRDRYNAERVIDLGFEAFLTKPVDPFNLARTVASLVGR